LTTRERDATATSRAARQSAVGRNRLRVRPRSPLQYMLAVGSKPTALGIFQQVASPYSLGPKSRWTTLFPSSSGWVLKRQSYLYSRVPEVFTHGSCKPTLFSQPQLNISCIADMIGYCARAVCEYLWHLTVPNTRVRCGRGGADRLILTTPIPRMSASEADKVSK
jgi:hypothetical protein